MNSATALHVFLAVLIMGTLWRLASYHAVASSNETVAHLGRAMAFQF
jgi:hypothetical protein